MGQASQATPEPRSRQSVHADFLAPPGELDGCFTTFYHLTLDVPDGGVLQDHLQPEWANLRFFCGGRPNARIANSEVRGPQFCATGPSSLPCAFELGTSRMWGMGILPLGWARLINSEACDVANVVCDGADHPVFARFSNLSQALCNPEMDREEQFAVLIRTLESMMRPNRDEPKILRVHEAIVTGAFTSVGDLADACGMSIRTLERVCGRYFGFSPKLLMRRQRFMRSLTSWMLHRGTRWTEAMDAEYHDQAQFTREFHAFMTMNPSEYAALDHPILTSFMEARARIWGSAAQTLDHPSR